MYASEDEMIAFATLFLGLILGVREVELVVGDDVAAVEVRLNDRQVATLSAPPWKLDCDFGAELVPQELTAVALDAGGREVGRARQWINLPQPPAHVTVTIVTETLAGGGEEHVARLEWESLAGGEPQAVAVTMDGAPLVVDDPRRVVLPPHDPRQLHFLRAELDFGSHVSALAEVTFGGTFAGQVSLDLTAVPVLAKKNAMRRDGTLDGVLVDGASGAALAVAAVERGPAQVIVVPDRGARAAAADFDRRDLRRVSFGSMAYGEVERTLRAWASLRNDQHLRFLWPVTEQQQGRRQVYDLFPRSHEHRPTSGGLYHLLLNAGQAPHMGEQRLADAVAVAGLHAAEQRQRRAVVLLLGERGGAPDPSQLTPQQSRRYLEHLRVPFAVWRIAPGVDAGAWGEARDVSSFDKLDRAVNALGKELDRQWLVWVTGIHLPQNVALAPGVEGVELAR
jgi:hypothetical protein